MGLTFSPIFSGQIRVSTSIDISSSKLSILNRKSESQRQSIAIFDKFFFLNDEELLVASYQSKTADKESTQSYLIPRLLLSQ